jgi:integration host factor subunit beta
MMRSELIRVLSEKNKELPYNKVEAAARHIFELMVEALCHGERIEIRGFGSFALRFQEPRQARNPRTGTYVMAKGRYLPYFKAGKELRQRVNRRHKT